MNIFNISATMKNTYNSVQVTIAIVCLLVTLVTGAYQCDILYTIPCKTGGLCYDKYMECNGIDNCPDKSDESNCTEKHCPWPHGWGGAKWCIPAKKCLNPIHSTCNCEPLCGFGLLCCGDGSGCYNSTQRCDGRQDCPSGDDEDPSICQQPSQSSTVLYKVLLPILCVFVLAAILIGCIIYCRKQGMDSSLGRTHGAL